MKAPPAGLDVILRGEPLLVQIAGCLEKPSPMMRYKRGGEGLKQATKALWNGGFHHRPTVAWQSTHLEAHFFLQFLVNPEVGQEGIPIHKSKP